MSIISHSWLLKSSQKKSFILSCSFVNVANRLFHRFGFAEKTENLIFLSSSFNLDFMLRDSLVGRVLNARWRYFIQILCSHPRLHVQKPVSEAMLNSNIWKIFFSLFEALRRTHLFNSVRNLWPHYANRLSLLFPPFPVHSFSGSYFARGGETLSRWRIRY